MLSLQDGTTTTPRRCLLGLFDRMHEVAPCRQRTLDRRHIPWIRLSSELFQSKPYRMTMLIQTMQLFVHCELSAFKTFLLNWKFFLDLISPEFCQLGEVKWNWINLMTSTDQLPSWRLNEFLTETLQVKNTPNPTWCHDKPLSTCNVPLLLFGEAKGEKRAAPLTLQSRCEGGKMRVLIGLLVHGILQTQQKSQLSLPVASLKITRLNLASFVSGCTTALYTVEIAGNGVEPRTSTTVTSGTVPMPTPHVATFLVSCYVSAQLVRGGNWVASVALDPPCDRAYSFAHQDKSSRAAVSCPLAIERVQGQTELLRWLWLKRSNKF